MTKHPANRLIHESSPYLLQHAYNPVDWYPWGEEALQRAISEDKPILVSIGYSACHWCHVMERESFEDTAVARIMNEKFICIKIDREERPDLDHIYMDALQVMTGSGGWPLNIFLTPDARPFYGGTYFPPARAHNRPSWTEVLQQLSQAWQSRREEINEQAEALTEHLESSSTFQRTTTLVEDAERFRVSAVDEIFSQLMKTADTKWGGFGAAPKFPQTFTIRFLLQYYHYTGNREALDQALLSLDKMMEGGIFDQVGGGLARYSTDTEWLAPHFEKMLYDNALFVMALADAFSITREKRYEKAIRKTLDFVLRELRHPEGGFYAALDADSEGEEGLFYVWDKREIDAVLGTDSPAFCRYFDVSEKGNWEETNILRRMEKANDLAQEFGMNVAEFEHKMDTCLGILYEVRTGRVRPGLDDKILLGWNAMMISAFCRASAVLGDEGLGIIAKTNFNNILNYFRLRKYDAEMQHTYKNGVARYPAFLDDYALLIQACINLQEITSEPGYLMMAKQFTEHVIGDFFDPGSGYFFYTGSAQKDLIVRKKEYFDGATPSGNGLMAENLFYLAGVFGNSVWEAIAQEMAAGLSSRVVAYPGSFGVWASLFLQQAYGTGQVVITGTGMEMNRKAILQHFIPGRILVGAHQPDPEIPLFTGKDFKQEGLIYWCQNNSCKPPVKSPEELFLMIKSG